MLYFQELLFFLTPRVCSSPGGASEPARPPSRFVGDAPRVDPYQRVRPLGDRDRPLRVLAQREAGDAERGCLLLEAAGVGDHQGGLRGEAEEFQVAERVAETDPTSRSADLYQGNQCMTGSSHTLAGKNFRPAPLDLLEG